MAKGVGYVDGAFWMPDNLESSHTSRMPGVSGAVRAETKPEDVAVVRRTKPTGTMILRKLVDVAKKS